MLGNNSSHEQAAGRHPGWQASRSIWTRSCNFLLRPPGWHCGVNFSRTRGTLAECQELVVELRKSQTWPLGGFFHRMKNKIALQSELPTSPRALHSCNDNCHSQKKVLLTVVEGVVTRTSTNYEVPIYAASSIIWGLVKPEKKSSQIWTTPSEFNENITDVNQADLHNGSG